MNSKINWSQYGLEFLSVFIAVMAAFWLNNWNDQRKSDLAEEKILLEINSGLEKDLYDIEINLKGRKMNITAVNYFRDIVLGKDVDENMLVLNYFAVLRDLISIQNVSGYETLKSRGFELVKNDTLRNMIISLYEYDFTTVKILEEDYPGLNLHELYFKQFNEILSPHFVFTEQGIIDSVKTPVKLSLKNKNKLLGIFMHIDNNNLLIDQKYKKLKRTINKVKEQIEKEFVK